MSRAEGYPGYINVISPKYVKYQNDTAVNADSFVTNYTANNVSVEIMRPGARPPPHT